MQGMKLYLDVCCLNRPFDDQTQDRIRLESEAVIVILGHFQSGDWQWLGSEVIDFGIAQTPDFYRRYRVRTLVASTDAYIRVGDAEIRRAKYLETLGFSAYDALHLACAESGAADVLLTTDDRFLRRAARVRDELRVAVANPLTWLQEMMKP